MPISASDMAALSRLLDDALPLSPSERQDWFDALPDGASKAMLGEVLAQYAEQETVDFLGTLPKLGNATAADETIARAGDQIGPYRLIGELGQGGMGTVWLAERVDGRLQREVALKLPRLVWGAGLAARMGRERDIGARLEHPNIARLYDAGLDALGRPYLAFEYIQGRPLDTWCAEKHLGIRERLRLFLQVARAVAYAHARLVVHRDLKPSNVLVDDSGQARLLDFGIAKLLRDDGTDQTDLTRLMGRVLTPQYASPEQFRSETITVASDVYSLGVLLYELLTGTLPHHSRRASLAALEEAILEGAPPLASSRVGDRATARALRGEVDAILTKALKRAPDERYATADALAQDIERHLLGERVLAQPDSAWYRLRKIARRHRTALALVSVALMAVLGGAGVAVVQAQRANTQAALAGAVKDFVLDVFRVTGRDNPANAQLRQLPVELLLERGARRVEAGFVQQPALRGELHGVLAGAFLEMASYRFAAEQATKQIEVLDRIDAPEADRADARLLLARALASEGKLAEAESTARAAAGLGTLTADSLSRARLVLCEILIKRAQYPAAMLELEQIRAAAGGEANLNPRMRIETATLHAEILRLTNRLDEAIALLRRAIDLTLIVEGPQSSRAIDTHLSLARVYTTAGRASEAKAPLATALAAMRSLGGKDDIAAALIEAKMTVVGGNVWAAPYEDVMKVFDRLDQAIAGHGRAVPEEVRAWIAHFRAVAAYSFNDVEQAYEIGWPAIEKLLPRTESPADRAMLLMMLDSVAMETGRHDEANRYAQRALDETVLAHGPRAPQLVWRYVDLAMNLSMSGRHDEAVHVLSTMPALEPRLEANPRRNGETYGAGLIALLRAQIELDRGDPSAALRFLQPMVPLGDTDFPGWDPLLYRGRALCAAGQTVEGLPLFEAAVAREVSQVYKHSHWLAWDRAMLGQCALRAGDRRRAEELANLARETFQKHPGVAAYFKKPSRELDRQLRMR